MSVKEDILRARQLIQDKKFDEARAILENVDHPKAKEWLAKLNARPQTRSKRAATKSKTSKANPAKTSSRSNFMLPIIILILLVVIVGSVAVLVVPNLLNNPSPASQSQAVADTENMDNENAEPESNNKSEDERNTSEDASPNSTNDEIVGSGSRLPILASSDFLFDVELPDGYRCNCDGTSNRIYGDDPSNSFRLEVATHGFDADYFVDKTIDDMLAELVRDDETIAGQETMQMNGRDVVVVHVEDEDGEIEITYNIKDGDGHIIRVTIPNWMDNPDALHEAALFVAGNVEVETGDAPADMFAQLNEAAIWFDEDTNRWYFNDPLDLGRINSVELPEGWVIEPETLFRMAVKNDDADTSATAIASMQQKVFDSDMTFEEWIDERFSNSSDEVESQEVITVGEREVVIRVEYDADADQRTTAYYVKDSDRNLISLITQPYVAIENHAALRDDILAMASTVESEAVTWEEQLQRIGVLEG